MKKINPIKNKRLKEQRGSSVEEIVLNGILLDVRNNENYPGQELEIYSYQNYAWVLVTQDDRYVNHYQSRKHKKEFGMKKTKAQQKIEKEIEKNPGAWKSNSSRIKEVQARNDAMRVLKEAKDGKINMRISKGDLEAFSKIADDKGIPYQTLLSSLIKSYVKGSLVDVEEVKKVLPAEWFKKIS